MAVSPAHRWGQIIGNVIEAAVLPLLQQFAAEHRLYLDMHGQRPCRKGRKCIWVDSQGNAHQLDFVLERGGTPDKVGTPAAFIETAWRRYTKHSRNKAQEIQGAIVPLAETHARTAPFKGAILAGVFTEGALTQMRSLGFTVLYFPYEMVLEAFRRFGINASSEENTPDAEFRCKIRRHKRLTPQGLADLSAQLMQLNAQEIEKFRRALTHAVCRRIERVVVLPLHGNPQKLGSLAEAIAFIRAYQESGVWKPVQRYEVQVKYSNGDTIEGRFADKQGAIDFLQSYAIA